MSQTPNWSNRILSCLDDVQPMTEDDEWEYEYSETETTVWSNSALHEHLTLCEARDSAMRSLLINDL